MSNSGHPTDEFDRVRDFYDGVYYRGRRSSGKTSGHHRRLARRIAIRPEEKVLDVGCGTGEWLTAMAGRGAIPAGVDISEVAAEVCRRSLPEADVVCGPAEDLPFPSGHFDAVTCLGSLEHFLDPISALREMVRVGKPGARILLLVPNAGFLTRRLGLYGGTWQADVQERVLSLQDWEAMFTAAGLRVTERWRDLHVISSSWIRRGPWHAWPTRLLQALALSVWPLSWQYQVYHLCSVIEAAPSRTAGDPRIQ